uniref:Uncharacterized protein n=1 Tax=Meloidogyne enterolobii TaxID=390850 RepID=A0A6V7VHW1_MELEN|nr:unnamed protein product [Meloidogyne enterolobii]
MVVCVPTFPPQGRQIFERCEVAKKFNFGQDVAKFLEKLEYSEELQEPILFIDFIQMNQNNGRLYLILWLVQQGATIVGTSGTVVKFDDWHEYHIIQQKMRGTCPWALYSSPNITYYANGLLISRVQTIRTAVIYLYSENKFVSSDIQFFEV